MSWAGPLGIATGLLPAAAALHHALDRGSATRWRNTAFWGAFAVTAMAGPLLPDLVDGGLVLLMVVLATRGLRPGPVRTTSDAERIASSGRLGARLFLPALCVPAVTFGGALLLRHLSWGSHALVPNTLTTLVSLAIALCLGLVFAVALTRPPPGAIVAESRRLSDDYGWAMVLPQILAALGGIFAIAGVGNVVAQGAVQVLPDGSAIAAVAVFCVGMALFTMLIGNAFTAFPIMMGGIGIPIIVRQFGGDPAIVAALGMLSGFCGTLMTPMAATFNIVPVALLRLPDRWAVIRVQTPTALFLLLANAGIIIVCAFPGGFR